jgi:hypothetical protein
MVSTISLPTVVQRDSAGSSTSANVLGGAHPEVSASSYPGRFRVRLSTMQNQDPNAAPEVVFASSAVITSPEVSKDLQVAAKQENVLVLGSGVHVFNVVRNTIRPALSSLPKTKISITFEPHLRQLAVKRIQDLMSEFRQSIGKPEVATVREELRGVLTETYKRAALSSETRTFATAISMLQDFLRPHWSSLPEEKLTGVDSRLSWLSSQKDLNTSTLTRFYRDLVGVLNTRISLVPSATAEDDGEDESDE